MVNDPKFPRVRRVAVQLASFNVIDAYNETSKPDRAITIAGIPDPDEMTAAGLGKYLR